MKTLQKMLKEGLILEIMSQISCYQKKKKQKCHQFKELSTRWKKMKKLVELIAKTYS